MAITTYGATQIINKTVNAARGDFGIQSSAIARFGERRQTFHLQSYIFPPLLLIWRPKKTCAVTDRIAFEGEIV